MFLLPRRPLSNSPGVVSFPLDRLPLIVLARAGPSERRPRIFSIFSHLHAAFCADDFEFRCKSVDSGLALSPGPAVFGPSRSEQSQSSTNIPARLMSRHRTSAKYVKKLKRVRCTGKQDHLVAGCVRRNTNPLKPLTLIPRLVTNECPSHEHSL